MIDLVFQMENKTPVDLDSTKLDAVIQLKIWQKKMLKLVDNVYANRLQEIDQLGKEIEDTPSAPNILVHQSIPDNFQNLIERTIRIKTDGEDQTDDDDDDDLVIIDVETNQEQHGERVLVLLPTPDNPESRVSKILHSEPIQQALTATLVRTITHMSTLAATSATAAAATTMAKTAVLSTACGLGTVAVGMGKIAIVTTQKVWSIITSSNAL